MSKSSSAATPHEAPDFATFITDLDHGAINQILTEKLADVVRGVRETNKVGELTIKIAIKTEGGRAVVVLDAKTKKPEHALHGTLFYVGENGELLREDPKQLKLKHLDGAPLKMRTVAFPTAGGPPAPTAHIEIDVREED